VGLGFALNAGGNISCNQHGRQDNYTLYPAPKVIDIASLSFMDYYDAARGMFDMEPDDYMLNMPGASGKFVMSPQRQVFLTPSQPVKIEPLGDGGTTFNGLVGGWRVTTADGIQYLFMAKETTCTESPDGNMGPRTVTAWNMTKIISTDKVDTIEFHYEAASHTLYMPGAEHYKEFIELVDMHGCDGGGGTGGGGGINVNYMATQRLRKITFAQGSIEFIPTTTTRCDLQLDRALDRIIISNVNGEIVKGFSFRYGYMIDNQINPVEGYTCISAGAGERERLMLLSVQENGKSPYTFDYIHDLGLPTRQSKSQDHWGFYNKPHDEFGTLVPGLIRLSSTRAILGKGREPNFSYGKQGTLSKITYPTGGETEFTYQSHNAALSSWAGDSREFGEAYAVTNVGPVTYQVDYGAHNQQVATIQTKSLDNKTFISFKIEVYQESLGTSVKLVNALTNAETYCVGGQNGPVRTCNCGEVGDATYKIVVIRNEFGGGGQPTGQFFTLTLNPYTQTAFSSSGSIIPIGGLRIQRITDRDPLTGAVYEKEFEYSAGILTWGMKYPKAYLNYLLYDRNFKPLTQGYRRMTTDAKENGSNRSHELLAFKGANKIEIKEAGYIYLFLSYEPDQAAGDLMTEVYFDDFQVTHTKSPVIQADDYYPYGVIFNSVSKENNIANHYQYNGKEKQDELAVEWLDYGARMYDPVIGRWSIQDAHAESYLPWSPYNYAFNNPINAIDPDGNDIYILTWFSSTNNGGETGHAGIAIDNYKTVNKKDAKGNNILDANGNPVTEQVKDGTFTYYDLWPQDPVGQADMQTDVGSGYSEGIRISSLSDLTSTDVTTQVNGNVSTEGRAADGIVKIKTSFTQDDAAKKAAQAEVNNKKSYNACANNCSTFTQRIANAALGGNQIDAKQRVTPNWFMKNVLGYKTADVIAPNNLYSAALKVKNATRVKGPQSVTARPYLEYFGK
jgi:RHS repeat-associated protein